MKLPKMIIPPDVVREQSDNVSKLLSVFTEGSAYLADHIRIARMGNLEKILTRGKEICEKHNIPPNKLPLKFMIPFGEKCSYEEDKGEMFERWASLLASSASDPSKAHPAYIDILSQIGPEEALLLKSIWEQFSSKNINLLELMAELTPDILGGKYKYGHLISAGSFSDESETENDLKYREVQLRNIKSMQILERQNLLRYNMRRSYPVGDATKHYQLYATLTPLGFDFTEACEKFASAASKELQEKNT